MFDFTAEQAQEGTSVKFWQWKNSETSVDNIKNNDELDVDNNASNQVEEIVKTKKLNRKVSARGKHTPYWDKNGKMQTE